MSGSSSHTRTRMLRTVRIAAVAGNSSEWLGRTAVSGPPVLLVRGFASSFERNWRETGWADLLGDAGREVIGVDLLGHGSADKPHDPAAYADVEADVRAALPDQGSVDAVG